MKSSALIFIAIGFLFAANGHAQQDGNASVKVVNSTESQSGQRLSSTSKYNVDSKNLQGLSQHQRKQAAAAMTRPVGATSRNIDSDFWIYDAFVTFDVDQDYDGYYSSFTVEFDADTYFANAEVYARLYLSRGDVFEEYHTSSLYLIHGDSSHDSLVIESDLVTGFPSGDYELMIELYDAQTDELVAIYDGYNDADLTLLTLESRSYEVSTVVVTREHGGAFGYLMLLLVPAALLRIKRTRKGKPV